MLAPARPSDGRPGRNAVALYGARPPSKVIMEGVLSPKVPRLPVASAGTVISSLAASARRGKS
eukprot:3015333-Lingulodinium_polyedra.AAC.1